jgi:hypothetical protein
MHTPASHPPTRVARRSPLSRCRNALVALVVIFALASMFTLPYMHLRAIKHVQIPQDYPLAIVTRAATPSSRRLLLCTHSRLMWWYYDEDVTEIIHEGQVAVTGIRVACVASVAHQRVASSPADVLTCRIIAQSCAPMQR